MSQTKKVLFFDYETDGLPPECLGYPTQMTFQVVDFNTRKVIRTYNKYIKGAKYLSPWHKEHSKITLELLNSEGVPYEEAMNEMKKYMGHGFLWVAHNLNFDVNVILRHGTAYVNPKDVNKQYKLCTCLSTTEYCKLPKTGRAAYYPGYKWPKLSELSEKLGLEFSEEEAHDSLYDVEMLRKCFFECVDRGIINVL